MKDLIIVGAGCFGRVILQSVKDINRIEKKWNIKGFIDDDLNALESIESDYGIIGTIKDWEVDNNEVFACGISSPKTKEAVTEFLKSKGATFETIVSANTIMSDFVTIGEGSFVNGDIGPNVILGDFTTILGSMIGQDSIIGDFSTTTGYANVAGAKLGKRVFVASHCVIINDLTIGDDAYIGVGSIVIRNVKAETKVFGYPARKIDI